MKTHIDIYELTRIATQLQLAGETQLAELLMKGLMAGNVSAFDVEPEEGTDTGFFEAVTEDMPISAEMFTAQG